MERGMVYPPDEDSFLLLKYVDNLVYGRVLDMGTGSGILAVAAAKNEEVREVMAVDIDPCALEVGKKRAEIHDVMDNITFVQSNLFQKVEGRFDWILFNPPYLPSEGEISEFSWAGGEKGKEVIIRFLEEAPRYLEGDGSLLLVYSDKTGIESSDFKNYRFQLLEEEKIFFETLYCVLLRPIPS
jgi:release factor glutamine methyltransferase